MRERVPLDWAASFGSQGVALMVVADRTNNAAIAETAGRQIQMAYEVMQSGGQERTVLPGIAVPPLRRARRGATAALPA